MEWLNNNRKESPICNSFALDCNCRLSCVAWSKSILMKTEFFFPFLLCIRILLLLSFYICSEKGATQRKFCNSNKSKRGEEKKLLLLSRFIVQMTYFHIFSYLYLICIQINEKILQSFLWKSSKMCLKHVFFFFSFVTGEKTQKIWW